MNPRRHPDPEAVALASGATAVLDGAKVVATLDAALAGCVVAVGLSARPREFAGRVLAVREAATAAIAHAAHGDVALVFGTEMSGLSNAELARCGIVATIPANAGYASLNLAAAVQVVAYELRLAAGGRDAARRCSSPRPSTRSRRCTRTARRRSRRCVSSTRGCRSGCCPGCAGSSRAPRWRRRKSTSCTAFSRTSTSCWRGRMGRVVRLCPCPAGARARRAAPRAIAGARSAKVIQYARRAAPRAIAGARSAKVIQYARRAAPRAIAGARSAKVIQYARRAAPRAIAGARSAGVHQ